MRKMLSNNRLESALSRPTRKSDALLLAAQPERYVPVQIRERLICPIEV
jgi:hypothetical protein